MKASEIARAFALSFVLHGAVIGVAVWVCGGRGDQGGASAQSSVGEGPLMVAEAGRSSGGRALRVGGQEALLGKAADFLRPADPVLPRSLGNGEPQQWPWADVGPVAVNRGQSVRVWGPAVELGEIRGGPAPQVGSGRTGDRRRTGPAGADGGARGTGGGGSVKGHDNGAPGGDGAEGIPGGEGPIPLAGNPQPAYPAMAMRRQQEGEVRLRIAIAGDGGVEGVEVVQSSGFALLDNAAMDAVHRWRFEASGRRMIAEQVIRFALSAAQ